ncbi:uncharacterized protein LOC109839474 isoform X1 [Asparagus officinalis]|nr:uncharacterized protein LOC109839474 isoform X1 [Asparagus officinalis]
MDSSVNRSRWRKRSQRNKPLLFSISLLFLLSLLLLLLLLLVSSKTLTSLIPFSPKTLAPKSKNPCETLALAGERFLWYAPHSGFSNQLSELRNAILISAILNRTLVVPPVLDHHAVALGSCPKFRVKGPAELRAAVWDHIMQLAEERRYVSMADIIDLSSITSSKVRIIDFRVFASLWCGLNMGNACFGSLCCAISGDGSLSTNSSPCRSLLSGSQGNVNHCIYALEEDCRTIVWTYQQENDGMLDKFQPDRELQKKKKISYVRKRRDIFKALGPGSNAETATVLALGSVFSSPYKGSELYIDIHEAPRDPFIQSLIKKTEFLPFSPEVIAAGKEFAVQNIKEPFLCAQLRLLDGQFKNHWKSTFSALKQKILSLKASGPIHIFIMTDLPTMNWTGTYLEELKEDTKSYKLFTLRERDDLIVQAAKKLMAAENSLKSSFLPRNLDGIKKKRDCDRVMLPDVLLYVEETVCSCATMGFVGTAGSTIAESIEIMRKNNACEL